MKSLPQNICSAPAPGPVTGPGARPLLFRRTVLRQLGALGLGGLTGAPGVAAAAAFEVRPWPPNLPAPRLSVQDLDGRNWDLERLHGRAVLLNFWATWCEPCLAEMPSLQDVAAIYGEQRLQVLAINYKESAAKALQFARTSGLTLPIVRDHDGAIARAWGVRVFPSTVLIDAAGRPVQRVIGEVEWSGAKARGWLEASMAGAART